ncbi:hypothetical protein Tco_0910811 [Tanacetum coccineum]|uniref:Uncharacterized protein n=1 Tax=Tanacetum coccineum TaxID=301880 RepID=A0ABQ5CTX8_9ASTR
MVQRIKRKRTLRIETGQIELRCCVYEEKVIVPTGRVVVPTGRYVVPAGKDLTMKVNDASVYSEATIAQQQQNIQPQIITTVSNNNAKFPYLKKDNMSLGYLRRNNWITNTLPFRRGNQRQEQPLPHISNMDDARDIWNAVKARFGGNAESKKMRKSMLKQRIFRVQISEVEDCIKGSFKLKLKSGLELLSFDDLLRLTDGNVIEDVLQSFAADTEPEQQLAYKDFEQIEKIDLEEMDLKWQMAMLSVRVHKFEQKAGRKIDLIRRNLQGSTRRKSDVTSVFKEATLPRECNGQRKEANSKALTLVDTLVDWTEHDGQSDGVIAPKVFGMIVGCDTEDAIEEGAAKIYNLITGADTKEASTAGDAGEFALIGVTSEVHNCPFGCDNKYNELQKQHNELNEQNSKYFIQVQAYKNSLKTLEKQKRVLQKNQLTLEDKIRVLSIELENTTNLLKHSERINAIAETAKKELQTKLDNHLVQIEKWRTSTKNLFRLIDSSMSVRTKVCQADSIKAVPPPLSRDYTPLSDYTDLDESQMSNTKDFGLHDSSVKSTEPKSYDSTTSCHQLPVSPQLRSEAELDPMLGHISKTIYCSIYLFVPQAVLLRTSKVNIPPARPQPVPTGKPKVPAPVPTGCSWKTQEKFITGENPYSDAEDEGIFDSGCSRSMTGNMERLDDFQEFQRGKVTFGGGEGRITRKGTIRTPTLDSENVYYVKEP